MRRSNSRETRQAVEAYVLEAVEAINDRADQENTPRPVAAAYATIREEMNWQSYYGPASDRPVMGEELAAKYEAAHRYDHYAAANPYRVLWLYASIGELETYTSDISRLLAQWLEETPEEAERYSDTEAERLFYHLTAQAFERLYSRENHSAAKEV